MSDYQVLAAAPRSQTPKMLFSDQPPLLKGEDRQAYDELLGDVTDTVRPSDMVEEIWTREVVDLTWEIHRGRHLKASALNTAMTEALERMLARPLGLPLSSEVIIGFEPTPAKTLAQEWAANDPAAIKRVYELLSSIGATMEDIQAKALVLVLKTVSDIDRLIMFAEGRRNTILREIDRRRDHKAFAKVLRNKVRDIDNEDFNRLETKIISQGDTADREAA